MSLQAEHEVVMSDDRIGETAEESRPAAVARQAYHAPVLVRLGSLRDMTLSITTTKGNPDGSKTRRTGRGGRFDAAGLAS